MKLSRATAVAAALAAVVLPLRAELINGVQAVVHDSVITHHDIWEETAKAERELRRDYFDQPAVYEKRLAEAEKNNLDHLTERQLINHEFKTAGYNLPERVIDDEVEADIRSQGSRAAFIKTLEAQGTTLERYRMRIRERVIEMAMREAHVSSVIIISPHKVETYYQEHRDSFRLDDRVKLRLIALKKSTVPEAPQARKMAEEILAKVKEGVPFAELASVYSEGRSGRAGGEASWYERPVLRKELAEAAFALKAGQSSGVIETSDSCYLLQVDNVELAHFRPLTEVHDQIEKDLQDQERARLLKQWVDKLKKKTFVAYYW